MDDPGVYGNIVHKLTFAEAARRNIICHYKIVISVVTNEMISEELLRRGEIIVEGDVIKARQVANQITVQKACHSYGLSKVFTFHSSVRSAKSFTGGGGQSIVVHLPEYKPSHVNGEMPVGIRERLIRAFAETDKAVMSNCRCLTDGIDVPAVDMIAFLAQEEQGRHCSGHRARYAEGSEKTEKDDGLRADTALSRLQFRRNHR
jgi:superfamily II DNA or RNA helicase